MSPGSVIVSEIGTQGSFQMQRVEDDEMVQAVPADRADQAFDVGILPGTPRGAVLLAEPRNKGFRGQGRYHFALTDGAVRRGELRPLRDPDSFEPESLI